MLIQEQTVINGKSYHTVRQMTAEEELICPPVPEKTLTEKIQGFENNPELNEILAELIDLPNDDEESEEE